MFGDYIDPSIFTSSFKIPSFFDSAGSTTIDAALRNNFSASFSTHAVDMEKAFALDIIEGIANLEDDWDGYGAPAISDAAILNARLATHRLIGANIPDITPNPNGTISMEWESEDGLAHLEIGDSRFSFFMKTVAGFELVKDGAAGSVDPIWKFIIEQSLFQTFPEVPTLSNSLIYDLQGIDDRKLSAAA